MCGIVGVVDRRGKPVDIDLLTDMCEVLRHRGPDEGRVIQLPQAVPQASARVTAGFGSRRLSIIDIPGGSQPISNEDGTVWTVLNGEIYNYRELRAELEQRGHRFATRSDTEVIVHLYEEHGSDCVRRLDGMFAIALWDARHERLVLARDRFGKKPLFYTETDDRIRFASELQALLVDPSLERQMDPEALDAYLSYGAIPAPLTIFRGVRKLPPAHCLVYDAEGTRLERYWSLAYLPKLAIGEKEAADHVLTLLTAAVKKRLMGEVPLGVLLSGGLDSSAVVALAAQLTGKPVKTFSIGFEAARYNELPYARRVADYVGCEHHEFIVKPNATEVLPELVRNFGEPFGDSSAVPMYYLSQMARQHVTVALNGDGGDEVFAGYRRHLANRLADTWQRRPAMVRKPLAQIGRRLLSSSGDALSRAAYIRRFLESSELPRTPRYLQWVGVFHGAQKAALRQGNGGAALASLNRRLECETLGLDPVDAALAIDAMMYLPTDLLVKADIMSMAHSLEVRSPFLDCALVEFVAQLPSHLKLKGFTSKYIMKRAVSGLLPPEVLQRDKHGFAVPIGLWFRHELKDFLSDHLLSSRLAQRGIIRQEAVEALVTEHLSGRADYAQRLWLLLMLELWYRMFIET